MPRREDRPEAAWTAAPTRIPYRVFTDRRIYAAEQAAIFRGPFWCYLALEAEIPNPGDFTTSVLGETPIIVQRDAEGDVAAFVNRCSHRGALVCRETSGHTAMHTCVYHQWSFDQTGALRSVPFARGVRGVGGYPADFDLREHGLTRLRVARYAGVIFGSLGDPREALPEYLGVLGRTQLDRVFQKPLRILGYQRQRIRANWKLYPENIKDPYHAGLLHYFFPLLGILRPTMRGGVLFDEHCRHTLLYSARESHDRVEPDGVETMTGRHRLNDESILAWRQEMDDFIVNFVLSLFPSVVVQQIFNTLAVRHSRPKSVNEFELHWTYFGYADDDDALRRLRLVQSNLVGPAGYVSMEDAEAIELIQRAVESGPEDSSFVEMGGCGPPENTYHLLTEVGIRGFWGYCGRVMGFDGGGDGDDARDA